MNDKQQTKLTFFIWPRTLLGWIWVGKRVLSVITIGSIGERYLILAMVIVGIREAVSAITDYAEPSDPAVTTTQSSPPNPTPTTDEKAK